MRRPRRDQLPRIIDAHLRRERRRAVSDDPEITSLSISSTRTVALNPVAVGLFTLAVDAATGG